MEDSMYAPAQFLLSPAVIYLDSYRKSTTRNAQGFNFLPRAGGEFTVFGFITTSKQTNKQNNENNNNKHNTNNNNYST